jgi:hypothetical protein
MIGNMGATEFQAKVVETVTPQDHIIHELVDLVLAQQAEAVQVSLQMQIPSLDLLDLNPGMQIQ